MDTSALIALEKNKPRITALLKNAYENDTPVTIPSAVLVEWWRSKPKWHADILGDAYTIEPLDQDLAKLAGVALASMPSEVGPIDAIVMASAAQRGDVVYASDFEHLQKLRSVFKSVHLIAV